MLPRIGITVAEYPEYSGVKLREDYFLRVQAAGGLPLLLPPLPAARELTEDLLQTVEGLIVSGGGDYDTRRPGRRDVFELNLLQAAWTRKLPVLGICRGLQGLCLALGGELWPDLRERPEATLNHDQAADRRRTSHPVHALPPLDRLYGQELLLVNSHHHQGVRQLPTQLSAAARSPDGLLEAACSAPGQPFAWGVQWHPEALAGHECLFQALVAAARGNG